MSANTVKIHFSINFQVILITVLFVHLLMMAISTEKFPSFSFSTPKVEEPRGPLKIRDIRTVGARDSKIKSSTYLTKTDSESKEIRKERFAKSPNDLQSNVALPSKKSLSLKDLTVQNSNTKLVPKVQPVRPGTRPGVLPQRAKAISGISLSGKEIQRFAQASNPSALGGETQLPALNSSDVAVNLEVPEGVDPDELNEYEMKFYGFQRRTAMNYINSFYKNLDKFQRENPHLTFPMTDAKQVMTGRLTYDEKGNIKQIKMIRWTNEDRVQNFFEDVLKGMDTLHNPPQALWEKSGEFSIFFTLVLNG